MIRTLHYILSVWAAIGDEIQAFQKYNLAELCPSLLRGNICTTPIVYSNTAWVAFNQLITVRAWEPFESIAFEPEDI